MIIQRSKGRGTQVLHRFENEYGASVISDGYGADQGLFELAVVRWEGDDYKLCYSTPITNDVLGWLTAEEVEETLSRIEALTATDVAQEVIKRKREEVAELQGQIDRLNAEIEAASA